MKLILITIILIMGLFISVILGINSVSWRDSYSCDIGEENITGDYELTSSKWYNKWLNERSCAIEDCSAYNKIQK